MRRANRVCDRVLPARCQRRRAHCGARRGAPGEQGPRATGHRTRAGRGGGPARCHVQLPGRPGTVGRLPIYPGFRVGLPGRAVRAAIENHAADLVHLAGPFVLGSGRLRGRAATSASRSSPSTRPTCPPTPARTTPAQIGQSIAWRRLRAIHNAADRNLAPCTATAADLDANGVERVWIWARGVDSGRFDPAKRSPRLRAELAPGGELIVGYVGRLATEKRVDLLAPIAALPGVRVVIVGSGPAEAAIRRAVPDAIYLGQRGGEDLATHLRQLRRLRAQRPARHLRPDLAGSGRERAAR